MSLTSNKNFLSPNGFRLVIDKDEFANIEYFCINSALPPVGATQINQSFRNFQNSFPGEKIEYSPLEIRYMVTERMENYIELFNWLVGNSQSKTVTTADIILTVLSSNNNMVRQIKFVDAFPTALGQIDFHTQNTDVEYVIADATFNYNSFSFI